MTERQKVTRKIKQTHKRLDLADGRSEKKKITQDLQGLRVDLNYITVSSKCQFGDHRVYNISVEALSEDEEIYFSLPA
jgi:hypothetical protein